MADNNDTDRNGWQIAEEHVQQHEHGSPAREAVEALIRDLRDAGTFRDARREQARTRHSAQVAVDLADAIALHRPHPEAVQG